VLVTVALTAGPMVVLVTVAPMAVLVTVALTAVPMVGLVTAVPMAAPTAGRAICPRAIVRPPIRPMAAFRKTSRAGCEHGRRRSST